MKIPNKIIKIEIAFLLTVNFLLLTVNCFSQSGAAINTTGNPADASAILDISSTNAGVLIPRLTKQQRNGITQPAEGLLIYQTDDTTGFWYRSNGIWKLIGNNTGSTIANGTAIGNTLYWNGSQWQESSNIYNAGGSVGIGTNNPDTSALIDMSSNTKGALIPRMTTAQRDAIQKPAEGLQIFNTTDKCLQIFQNNFWSACLNSSCGFLFKDLRDGNIYQTVQIGSQCWMAENLKYLPLVNSNSEFASQATNSQPGYGVYGYDGNNIATAKNQANYTTYGVLYNWWASLNACPIGWHLPDEVEWTQFINYLSSNAQFWCGGNSTQTAKSISATTNWKTHTNTCAIGNNLNFNNSSGYSAIPGGFRYLSGGFNDLDYRAGWWSITEDSMNAKRFSLLYSSANISLGTLDKGYGQSIRCLRN